MKYHWTAKIVKQGAACLSPENFRRTKKETNKVALQEHLLSKRKLSRPTINQRS